MEDKIISPMQDLLPGALSRWILVLSIGLSLFLLTWPSYDLPAKYLTDKDITKLLMRLLSAETPLLIGVIALIVLQVRHNRRTTRELTAAASDIKSYVHQVGSLSTDKNTLQTLIAEQKNKYVAEIEQLTSAANTFRDEARQTHSRIIEIQKELTRLQEEHKDLRQRNAGTESLAIMRGRKLEQCEKELEDLRKAPPPPSIGGWT